MSLKEFMLSPFPHGKETILHEEAVYGHRKSCLEDQGLDPNSEKDWNTFDDQQVDEWESRGVENSATGRHESGFDPSDLVLGRKK